MLPSPEPRDTRERILAATAVVLGRAGTRKLSLSDVAATAGVSRPTLYRQFASKQQLLSAFAEYEQRRFDEGLRAATTGLRGRARLDAALQFVVDFQDDSSLRRVVEVEPEHVLHEAARLLPTLQAQLATFLPDRAAGAVVRVAVSHYLVPGGDRDQFLDELRQAAGF